MKMKINTYENVSRNNPKAKNLVALKLKNKKYVT